jgi:glycosyltransferase involved in cell wall biosynthesis
MSLRPATALSPDCSVIVPVYRNEGDIDSLVARLADLHERVPGGIEAVCVVDGSPDACHALLASALPIMPFTSRLLLLSRNFGSFAAVREGLRAARGRWFAVMSADLQEDATVVPALLNVLRADEADVVLGVRESRADPWTDRVAAGVFWGLYRAFIRRDLPPGGVDVFGCNAAFRDQLVRLGESYSSLVGQILWLGFRRKLVGYRRVARRRGQSAWTLRRKIDYLLDSVYAFSDLPVRVFVALGTLGIVASIALTAAVLTAKATGSIAVPGYAATVLTIAFFGSLNLLGLGIVGSYVWRAYENTKARPLAVVMREDAYVPGTGIAGDVRRGAAAATAGPMRT